VTTPPCQTPLHRPPCFCAPGPPTRGFQPCYASGPIPPRPGAKRAPFRCGRPESPLTSRPAPPPPAQIPRCFCLCPSSRAPPTYGLGSPTPRALAVPPRGPESVPRRGFLPPGVRPPPFPFCSPRPFVPPLPCRSPRLPRPGSSSPPPGRDPIRCHFPAPPLQRVCPPRAPKDHCSPAKPPPPIPVRGPRTLVFWPNSPLTSASPLGPSK